jgi:hypothetical protein
VSQLDDDLNLPQDRPGDRSFYCEACRRSYDLGEWTIVSLSEDDDPIGDWYDCAIVRCAAGHERHADLAVFKSRNVGAPSVRAGRRPVFDWLTKVTKTLERRDGRQR